MENLAQETKTKIVCFYFPPTREPRTEWRRQQAAARSCDSATHLVLVHNGQPDRAVAGSGEVWQTVQVGNEWQTSDPKIENEMCSWFIVEKLQRDTCSFQGCLIKRDSLLTIQIPNQGVGNVQNDHRGCAG